MITERKDGSSRNAYSKLSERGLSSRSVEDLEFSSAVIAMNSSNSEKIYSSRRVPSMEWRILLPSSRRASKCSSNISSITSILKHVSSFEKGRLKMRGTLLSSSILRITKSAGKDLPLLVNTTFTCSLRAYDGCSCLDGNHFVRLNANYCDSSLGRETMIKDFDNIAFRQIMTMAVLEHFLHTKPSTAMFLPLGISVFKHIAYSEEFINVFMRIGFGSAIKLVSFDESQVVTFNGKFLCGFSNSDCGSESQSNNTVGSPHGFIIHWIIILKNIKKVTEVIDIEN
nr:hypothetical protein [Tanacetum cinerariifolium]